MFYTAWGLPITDPSVNSDRRPIFNLDKDKRQAILALPIISLHAIQVICKGPFNPSVKNSTEPFKHSNCSVIFSYVLVQCFSIFLPPSPLHQPWRLWHTAECHASSWRKCTTHVVDSIPAENAMWLLCSTQLIKNQVVIHCWVITHSLRTDMLAYTWYE